jgi:hypothetical protein
MIMERKKHRCFERYKGYCAGMKANENATQAGEKAIQAFNLKDQERSFDNSNPLPSTVSSVSAREQRNEDDEEAQRQTESWHSFKTP